MCVHMRVHVHVRMRVHMCVQRQNTTQDKTFTTVGRALRDGQQHGVHKQPHHKAIRDHVRQQYSAHTGVRV